MRMTRAALRAQTNEGPQLIHEDDQVSQDESDQTSNDEPARTALRDITDQNYPNAGDEMDAEAPVSEKKTRSRKTGKAMKQEHLEQEDVKEQEPEVAEPLQNESQIIVARSKSEVDKAQEENESYDRSEAQLENKDDSETMDHVEEEHPPIMVEQELQTPHREHNISAKTPKFDPELHVTDSSTGVKAGCYTEDSFVESIKTRSPSKMDYKETETSEVQDSFVAHITSRTPASSPTRIEDSVEAIDALEDAIEEVSDKLPAIENLNVNSPAKLRTTPTGTGSPTTAKIYQTQVTSKLARLSETPSKTDRASPAKRVSCETKAAPSRTALGRLSTLRPSRIGPTTTKAASPSTAASKGASTAKTDLSTSDTVAKTQPNTVKKRVNSAALSTSKPAFVPQKSTKPVTKSNFMLPGEVIAAKLKAQREERLTNETNGERKVSDSVSQGTFVPKKSTKLPTTSTFVLPGEAIAAKLKAQREERLKKEEIPEEPKKVFKARAVPSKVSRPSVLPRETKTSQARMSMLNNGSDKENEEPRRSAKPTATMSTIKVRNETTKANSAARRTTSVTKTTSGPRVSSLTMGEKSAVTTEEAVQQKARGKEVFARSKVDTERAEKERKDKEDAARKARVEAAERGRQASREWAEKQKKKVVGTATKKGVAGTITA